MRDDENFGKITENDIIGQFKKKKFPFRLRDYYAGAGIVPDTSTVPAAGLISFSDFMGGGTAAAPVTSSAGQQNYDTAGTYSFTLPQYTTLTVSVSGGSGGSGSSCWDAGRTIGPGNAGGVGGVSSFLSVSAGGGGGGQGNLGGSNRVGIVPGPGAPGNAVGGDTNTDGGGIAGAAHGELFFGNPTSAGGAGGNAGLATKTFGAGAAGAAGGAVQVVVGAGGTPGPALGNVGLAGHDGYVHISWT